MERCRENVWNERAINEKAINERGITTEIDTRTEWNEWASSVGLCKNYKPQHPHNVKVSPRRGLTAQSMLAKQPD